jgi:hypothetical protein
MSLVTLLAMIEPLNGIDRRGWRLMPSRVLITSLLATATACRGQEGRKSVGRRLSAELSIFGDHCHRGCRHKLGHTPNPGGASKIQVQIRSVAPAEHKRTRRKWTPVDDRPCVGDAFAFRNL